MLRGIADQFQTWLKTWTHKRAIPVLEAPHGRRDEFVDPYFNRAGPDEVVVILKAREPARIMTAIGDNKSNRWHLQIANRWVVQYNFYINDRRWGRMFVRICPYLPFSARAFWSARVERLFKRFLQQRSPVVLTWPSEACSLLQSISPAKPTWRQFGGVCRRNSFCLI